ncbi:hypothetical protein ACFWPX_01615 [Nocardia sp. NPDC058518]
MSTKLKKPILIVVAVLVMLVCVYDNLQNVRAFALGSPVSVSQGVA